MPTSPILLCLFAAALAVGAAASAQQPAGGGSPDNKAPTAPTAGPTSGPTSGEQRVTGGYDESASRELFRSCDGDSDDRLDIFETAQALDALHDARDSEAFARIDLDRDGFVSWPEFDQVLRTGLRKDGSFHVRTCRRLQPTPGPRSSTPLQQFLQLYDVDQDGGLDPKEVESYLQKANLPPLLGNLLKTLDVDHSGRIDEAELAPWFERLASPGPSLFSTPPAASSPLLPPWGAADGNRDGAIDADELAQVLRRLDPGLARWAPQLLQGLDKNKNGKLEPAELPGAAPDRAGATAKAGPALPAKAPLR